MGGTSPTASTVDAEGLSVLLASDPRISTVGGFGTGSVLRDPDVDVDQFVADTIEEACAEEPDLVLLHDHLLGRRIAEADCQEVAVLDGRSYEFLGPQDVPVAVGPTGHRVHLRQHRRARHDRPDPGTIKSPARFAILSVQPDSGDATYAVVTVDPDTTVTVTQEISLDVTYQEYLDTGHTGLPADADLALPGRP